MYKLDLDNCFNEKTYPSGINEREFKQTLHDCEDVIKDFKKGLNEGLYPAFSICQETEDLKDIENFAREIGDKFTRLVIFGTGGSSLCAEALCKFQQNKFKDGKKLIINFIDNVDPNSIDNAYKSFDFEKTFFLTISKSGGTIETLSQFLTVIDKALEQNIDVTKHFAVLTEPTNNPLNNLAKKFKLKSLVHNPKIGGRYSILSNVGLIPAAASGINISKIRQGAREVLEASLDAPMDSMPALGAAIHTLYMRKGIKNNVLMPYIDRLTCFNSWQRQVWGESLGKNGAGSTPIRAIGAIDQHSQLQLYLDGPKDKLYTIIALDRKGQGPAVKPKYVEGSEIEYLANISIGDILTAEQNAIIETFSRNNLPVRVIRLNKLDEITLGGLIMHFMLETVYTAGLLGVDPFDQPAVEQGKQLTRELLKK